MQLNTSLSQIRQIYLQKADLSIGKEELTHSVICIPKQFSLGWIPARYLPGVVHACAQKWLGKTEWSAIIEVKVLHPFSSMPSDVTWNPRPPAIAQHSVTIPSYVKF